MTLLLSLRAGNSLVMFLGGPLPGKACVTLDAKSNYEERRKERYAMTGPACLY